MATQVPVRDASCRFSEDDWNLLQEWQKELCGNVMKEINRALVLLGPLVARIVFSLETKRRQQLHHVDNQESERRDCATSSPSDSNTSHCELIIKEEHFQLSNPKKTEERHDCLSREEPASIFIDHLGGEIKENSADPDLGDPSSSLCEIIIKKEDNFHLSNPAKTEESDDCLRREEPASIFIDQLGEQIKENSADPDLEEPASIFIDHLGEEIKEGSADPDLGPPAMELQKKNVKEYKRPRTAFTAQQLKRLQREFQASLYITEQRRKTLAQELNMKESQIKLWFQNKRARSKRPGHEEWAGSTSWPRDCTSITPPRGRTGSDPWAGPEERACPPPRGLGAVPPPRGLGAVPPPHGPGVVLPHPGPGAVPPPRGPGAVPPPPGPGAVPPARGPGAVPPLHHHGAGQKGQRVTPGRAVDTD